MSTDLKSQSSMSTNDSKTFKSHIEFHLPNNKSSQSTSSSSKNSLAGRYSTKTTKDHNHMLQPIRKISSVHETSADILADLTPLGHKPENKHQRRNSDAKSVMEGQYSTGVDRRYSTPPITFGAFFQYAFRSGKNKQTTKDESNVSNTTSNQSKQNTSNSHMNHISDSNDKTTIKTTAPFDLKSPTISFNASRIMPSNMAESLSPTHNEDPKTPSLFIADECNDEPRCAELLIRQSHTPLSVATIYRQDFYEFFHVNYFGIFYDEGPFIASFRCIDRKTPELDTFEVHAIIRTEYKNYYEKEIIDKSNENYTFQCILQKANLPSTITFGIVGDPKANEKIYLFDKANDERYSCKIGVMYQRLNQNNELSILSNDKLPKDMTDFLDVIADRVSLKGFDKFRADLDTKNDLHGAYSYYTEYERHEIMFNIAPLIPSPKVNGQFIERKGLVGNAFVCVIFQETGAIFKPECISGKVTQIYITVQPIMLKNRVYYKVATWRRNDINTLLEPSGGLYLNDNSFRPYFLTLLLNATNAAIDSPSLRARVLDQRQRIKHEEIRKLSNSFAMIPIPSLSYNNDEFHYPGDLSPSAQIETFSTVSTADGGNNSTHRLSPSPHHKKKGFSRLLGVFSPRSGSTASSITSGHTTFYESAIIPQMYDPNAVLNRHASTSNKDIPKEIQHSKSISTPGNASRTSNASTPHGVSVQPPTPSTSSVNPFNPDNITQDNIINQGALHVETRVRSNSSPLDAINTPKTKSVTISTKDKVFERTVSVDEDEDDETEETSEDDDDDTEETTSEDDD